MKILSSMHSSGCVALSGLGVWAAVLLVAGYFQGAANSGWSLFGKYGFAHWINFGQYEGRGDGQGDGQ